jgi:PAS domain S-box-containing protein
MKRTLDGGVLIGIALIVALLCANAALALRNTQQLDDDARWVAQTHDVLDATGDVLLTLIDAETGQRGFLVTGRDEYLVPYDAALARWQQRMAILKDKTKENERQQQRITHLEALSQQEMALLKEGIDLRRAKASGSKLLDAALRAKKQMDEIRAVVAAMRQEEHDLLIERQQRTADAYLFAILTELLTTVVALFVVGALAWVLQRALRIRQKASEIVNEQREWLRTTLTSIGDAVICTDTQGRVTLLNPVAQTLTGWTSPEAHGQPLEAVFRIVNEHTRKTVENPALRTLAEGAIVGLANHTVLISRTGTEHLIDDSAAPIRDDRGHVRGAVLIFRDVSERRRADEARQRLAAIIESSSDAVVGKDLDGLVTSWNRGAEEMFGYSAAEIIGRPVSILVPDDHADEEPAILERIRRGEKTEHYDTVRRHKNGRLIDVSLTVSPIHDRSGRVIGASKIVRDITERKRLEHELRQLAADLSEANHRKDEFLATLAHELRNPLAPISNALHLIGTAGSGGHSLGQVRDMMQRQLGHLVRLVDDLLDVSRITRGKLELRKERLEVARVVESALETTRPVIEAAKHELTVVVPAQPLRVDGDLTRLAQVLSNLLSNAAKYTPAGGHIWLTVETVGDQVVIRVRDNGMGIPTAMLPRVFDMFTQGARDTRLAEGGLGIGLTLVRRLVELHGGTVEAHSAGLQRGSEFVVHLPLAVEPDAAVLPVTADRQTDHAAKAPARRILVVDDNRDSAESMRLLLQMMGHNVGTAHDGLSALEEAQKLRPDVVLLDIGLPGMTGYEVARKMRSLPELQHALLVAQTGWGQDDDRRRSAEAGFDAHLVKPVDQTMLQELLANWKIK